MAIAKKSLSSLLKFHPRHQLVSRTESKTSPRLSGASTVGRAQGCRPRLATYWRMEGKIDSSGSTSGDEDVRSAFSGESECAIPAAGHLPRRFATFETTALIVQRRAQRAVPQSSFFLIRNFRESCQGGRYLFDRAAHSCNMPLDLPRDPLPVLSSATVSYSETASGDEEFYSVVSEFEDHRSVARFEALVKAFSRMLDESNSTGTSEESLSPLDDDGNRGLDSRLEDHPAKPGSRVLKQLPRRSKQKSKQQFSEAQTSPASKRQDVARCMLPSQRPSKLALPSPTRKELQWSPVFTFEHSSLVDPNHLSLTSRQAQLTVSTGTILSLHELGVENAVSTHKYCRPFPDSWACSIMVDVSPEAQGQLPPDQPSQQGKATCAQSSGEFPKAGCTEAAGSNPAQDRIFAGSLGPSFAAHDSAADGGALDAGRARKLRRALAREV